MRKKNTMLLGLILIMSCLLCACGGNDSKATIVDNEGNEVQMTAKEVEELYDTNQVSFEKKYAGAKIHFIGTVESVDEHLGGLGEATMVSDIEFKEGWEVTVPSAEYESIILEMSAGTKVEVTTNIMNVHINVNCRGTSAGGAYSENTMKTTVLKIVE